MEGVSPEFWVEETSSSFPTVLPPKADRAAMPAIPSWLTALPHPAAIADFRCGMIQMESWNPLFERHFRSMVSGAGIATEDWQRHFVAEISAFALSGKEVARFEIERRGNLGAEAFACMLGWVHDGAPGARRILINAVDRTGDRRMEESLRRELVSDTLTALPNRIGFGEAIETILASPAALGDKQIGVMIVDLMRFSRINEALGTMAGDELILAVAARLKACVGENVILARLGGNEFGACHLVDHGDEETSALARRITAAIAAPIRLSDLEISINCAIGYSLMPATVAEADELIRQAQTAARVAKKSDRLEKYQPGELKVARQRFFLESHLRDTLAHGGLNLVYQPIIDLASSLVIGFEALARWHDPELGHISPNDFIPVAEESGLVVPLGRWALNEAMRQLNRWDARLGAHMPIKMNVNLSPIQIMRDNVVAMITDTLSMNEVDGDRLMIELTESAIVGDPENSRILLEALKRSNVAIAMDDFGTGFSNMANLQSLPIDVLKIDRSFVSDMLIDPDKMAITRAILSLSHALNIKATAEGIEDAEVAAALRDMGCIFGQGYYFAKPMTADDAYDYWLASRNSITV
tara:strand:+ start:48750 stop:50507 length:1758 start_codon:yes stop_codon:yes gene_type:complete